MPHASWLSSLSKGERIDLEERVDRFHSSWQLDGPFAAEPFLPPPRCRHRPMVLAEVVLTDMGLRAKAGLRVRTEDYTARHPKELSFALVDLLAEEHSLRCTYDRPPQLEEYRFRFPRQFDGLAATIRARSVSGKAARGSPPHRPGSAARDGCPTPLASSGTLGYQMVRRIGAGAFGEVFEAVAPGGVRVAVKRTRRPLDHPATRVELAALHALRELSHPFLLQPHAYWTTRRHLYVAMELADGSLEGEIAAHLSGGRPGVPAAALVPFVEQAAAALDLLHAHGIAHRDVKPANLLTQRGYVKLADFGLARKQAAPMDGGQEPTGTPLFMAPEVWLGRVGYASDRFSLAATYLTARCGRQYARWLDGQGRADPVPDVARLLDHLPAAERAAVARGLDPNPDGRYPTCAAFARAVREATTPAGWFDRLAGRLTAAVRGRAGVDARR